MMAWWTKCILCETCQIDQLCRAGQPTKKMKNFFRPPNYTISRLSDDILCIGFCDGCRFRHSAGYYIAGVHIMDKAGVPKFHERPLSKEVQSFFFCL